jgi:hypothetical protein
MTFGLRGGGSDMNKADVTPIAKSLTFRALNKPKTALDVGGFRQCGRRHTLVNALRAISLGLNLQAATDWKFSNKDLSERLSILWFSGARACFAGGARIWTVVLDFEHLNQPTVQISCLFSNR